MRFCFGTSFGGGWLTLSNFCDFGTAATAAGASSFAPKSGETTTGPVSAFFGGGGFWPCRAPPTTTAHKQADPISGNRASHHVSRSHHTHLRAPLQRQAAEPSRVSPDEAVWIGQRPPADQGFSHSQLFGGQNHRLPSQTQLSRPPQACESRPRL